MWISIRIVLAAVFTMSFAPLAAAQSDAESPAPAPPVERTITIDDPLFLQGDRIGPDIELVDVYAPPGGESLVPVRINFVDRLVRSADQI